MPELIETDAQIRKGGDEELDVGNARKDLGRPACWACGDDATYACGEYHVCETCAWQIAELGGAP